jgi:hypothetical protein
MPNYSQGKIYSIRSYLTEDVYYGSTCQKLSDRLAGHKKNYKRWLLNKELGISSSYRIFEKDIDAYIELLELYPCNSKIELHKREGEIIRVNVCVNKRIAGRTQKEYQQENKEQILEYRNQYHQNNKEQIAEKQKQRYINNKEHITEQQKQYRQDNKEQIADQKKQYQQDNKEVISQYKKQHYQNNREHKLEKMKQHYQNNKEQLTEHNKQYYQDNKEQIAEQRKVKYTCECGSTLTIHHKSTHEKSKKHQSFLV